MPLHCLAREENTEEIKKYVSGGGDLEAKDNWGRTALFWALDDQKLHIASLLLTLGADPNTKEENGISVFYRAVVSGKYYFADALLDSGAAIDIFNDDKYPETTLHHCVMKNNLECVAYLISKGANKNLDDSFGYTVFERLQMHDHITNEIRGLLKQ
jgi:ankyrin repeat protein